MATREELLGPGGYYEMKPSPRADHPEWGDLMCFQSGPRTLGEYYEVTMNKFLDRDFIVFGDERYTYAQVKEEIMSLAGGLQTKYGVKAGDRVAVSMRNYPEWCISFMAATIIGAVAVPLNSMWKEAEMMYGLEDSGTKVRVSDTSWFGAELKL
jgi:acyl-CoA synthetase (AMP-forming)/AMP-acid ligase II